MMLSGTGAGRSNGSVGATSTDSSVRGYARTGSWAYDDPDRPRWDANTESVAEYDYVDGDGAYLCTVRKGKHPDGDKRITVARRNLLRHGDRIEPEDRREWFPGAGGTMPTLYRLPELIAAPPGTTVFVVEGEKDVETLRAWGLVATCNFGGAEKWRHDYGQHVAGRHVVILPDNDTVGRAHASKVLESVRHTAETVKVLELPGLADKGDVSDWAAAGGTASELLRLAMGASLATASGTGAQPTGGFTTTPDGKPHPTQDNVLLALAKMSVGVSYDEFAGTTLVTGLEGFGPQLCDATLTRLRLDARRLFRLQVGKDDWNDMVLDGARRNRVHPVKAYWAGLKWDGIKRLDTWLIVYGGAPDTPFVRAVGALPLVASVRRVRIPGTKFDTMLVLVGEQGCGKSSAVAEMAVFPDWLMDGLELDADNKAVMELLAGRLIVEAAELKGMKRGDVEKVKAMLSRTHDRARLSYARLATQQPRTCIFIGTTNSEDFLRDMTGNRRFWPVTVGQFDLEALARDRDQLWAEAVAREAEGVALTLPRNLWDVAAEQQGERLPVDPWEEALAPSLDVQSGKVWSSDLWCFLGFDDLARRSQEHNSRLGAVMRRLGWSKARSRSPGARGYCYIKGEGATDELPMVELSSDRPMR